MKQTANIKLNQWEKSDRIMMSDFNGDNQKLDAALKTLTGENAALRQSVAALQTRLNTLTAQAVPQVLKEFTDTKGGNPLVLDMSFINWDLYDRIIIESKLRTDTTFPNVKFVDTVSGAIFCQAYAKTFYEPAEREFHVNRLTLYSHGDRNRELYVESIAYSTEYKSALTPITGGSIKAFNLLGTNDHAGMAPGCWFRITGVKV